MWSPPSQPRLGMGLKLFGGLDFVDGGVVGLHMADAWRPGGDLLSLEQEEGLGEGESIHMMVG